MEIKKRIYVVVSHVVTADKPVTETRLVRAKTAQGAINHVVADRITAMMPAPEMMMEYGVAGLKVEEAGE